MTLEGPQLDTCDNCNRVEQVHASGGMMLCNQCEASRCPRCAEFAGTWWDEWSLFHCTHCGESYIYKGV